MTTKSRFKLRYLFVVAAIVALALPWTVLADNVINDVEVGGNDTITAGESTTISYWIVSTGGDCNPANGSSATVTIQTPPEVSANPSQLVFSSCGKANSQSVQFTSNVPGSYPISVSVQDDNPGNGYNATPGGFTLNVLEAAAQNSFGVVIDGFHNPVSMPNEDGRNSNIVRGNRVVPLKFNVYLVEFNANGDEVDREELTELNGLGIALQRQSVACTNGDGDDGDPIDADATGKAGLRYDHAEGQWIHNWSTKGINNCNRVTVTATYDGAETGSTKAYFRIQ